MTRKHFEMVAKVLNNRAKAITNSGANSEEKHYALFELRNTMYHFCDEFEAENPRFDRGKFYQACEIQTELEFAEKLLRI
tara:strand:- start:1345 stop:1584 length:240 start_codon:yes stop_codon:yes gene_type:complete